MNVSVDVSATEAVIKMNGHVVVNVSPHHSLLSRGGVLIPPNNIMSYKNYMLIF